MTPRCFTSRKVPTRWASVSGSVSGHAAEIIHERLEREYDLDLITTAPTVVYELILNDGSTLYVDNPSAAGSNLIEVPAPRGSISWTQEYVGNVITLCTERRGDQIGSSSGQADRDHLRHPMAEVVLDFFDRLKSASRLRVAEYPERFQDTKLVVDVLINGTRWTPWR